MNPIINPAITLEILLGVLAARRPELMAELTEFLLETERQAPPGFDQEHLASLIALRQLCASFQLDQSTPSPSGKKPFPFHVIDGGKR